MGVAGQGGARVGFAGHCLLFAGLRQVPEGSTCGDLELRAQFFGEPPKLGWMGLSG